MKTQLLKHPAFRAVGLVLAVATVCPAITPVTLYTTLGSPPTIRGEAGHSYPFAAANRFTVSGPAAILTGFDLAINTTLPNNLTVSIYTDSIGVPNTAAVLGALVASTTFVNAQPACVPGTIQNVPEPCVPIFSGTMPGNVLLTPGNYWLALTASCNCVDWWYANGGEGNAGFDPTTNTWTSWVDSPWGFTVYGTPAVPMSDFSIQSLIISKPGFYEQGHFDLGAGSAGINPLTDSVTFTFGTASIVIPPGSFRRLGSSNNFWFTGKVNGVSMAVDILAQNYAATSYNFAILGSGLDLTSQAEPLNVGLNIGINTGSTTFKAVVF